MKQMKQNCEEWTTYRCDNYWDFSNEEDELNCPNTILFYITQTILKCRINEYYCVYRNGTNGLFSKRTYRRQYY